MSLGLTSAIHIAQTGMGVAEKSINVSGNNLANANTWGYKAERPDFSSFISYIYNYGYGEGQTYTAGSNPLQIGMGVELASVTTDFSQGSFKEGMTASDIAINGNGFLIVRDSADPNSTRQTYYTRDGALKINSNHVLVTNTGMYVMGYGIDDQFRIQNDTLTTLKIPINEMHIAQETSEIQIEGILNAAGESATQGTVLRTKPMTDLSKSAPPSSAGSITQIIQPNVEGLTTISGSNTSGGNIGEGKYLYRFAFADTNGIESDYSAPLQAEIQSGQNSLTINNLPMIPAGYTSLKIYRAIEPADPSIEPDFYLVDQLTNTLQSTYTDTIASSDLNTKPVLNESRLNGSYDYYVTYFDAAGNESRPVLVSNSYNVNGGQLMLSGLPVDESGDWSGRRIYRNTSTDPATFYLVGEIRNMDSNATLIDRISDADLSNGSHLEMNEAGRGNTLITGTTKLIDVGNFDNGEFVHTFETGTLTFTPTKGGISLKAATLEITNETTVTDYLKFLNESFGIRNTADGVTADQGDIGKLINGGVQGAYVINGSMFILGNSGQQNELELQAADTLQQQHQLDLGWTEIQQSKGESVSSDLQVFDSLGAPVSIRLTMVLESKSNTETVYRWYADSPDNQPTDGTAIATGTGLLRFDQNGRLIGETNTTISVERTSIASSSPLDFQFNMNLDAVMALAANSPELSQTYQDGAGAGTLYDYNILENGMIIGIFTSGVERPLGQIPLATFINQEGLYKAGDSLYQVSTNSGDAKIGIAGSDGVGSIRGRSLELSNTDMAQEIVDMILASAMYRSNAKIMTTSIEMYDALLRIN
ncbi:MAG: flagellar hook-basal body complex protein [Planctomycetaceae bacterium]|jgi:flagellar hook protein FlgE|nr:flagellar hook-basal body complex protein [Planctomycetaceae bacterium]